MKVKDSNNLKGAIIGNVLTSLSNFLIILLSTIGHNSYEHGFFSLVLSVVFGTQMLYLALFYVSGQAYLFKVIDIKKIRVQMLFLNMIISLFICVIFFSLIHLTKGVFYYTNNGIDNYTILLASMFIFSQLLADHCRQEVFLFDIQKMQTVLIVISFVIKIIGIYYSTDINISFFVLLLSNLLFLPRVFRIIKLKNFESSYNFNYLFSYMSYSNKIVIAAITNWFWYFFPIYILGYFHGLAIFGILLSLRSLCNIHSPLSSLLDNYALRVLNNSKTSSNISFMKLINKLTVVMWIFVFVFIWQYGVNIIGLIFGEKYVYLLPHLLILWGASGLFILTKNTISFLRINEKNLVVEFKASIISAVITLLIGPPLIFYKQISGAVIVYLLAFLSSYLYTQYKYIKYKPHPNSSIA